MMKLTKSHALALATLVLFGACEDSGVIPREREAFLDPAVEVGTGYIIGRYGTPLRVTYQVIDGRAILEGDIDLGPASQVPATLQALEATLPRSADASGPRFGSMVSSTSRWWRNPDGPGGRVPYIITPALQSQNPQRVYDAMQHISNRVAVQFVLKTTETAYVQIDTGSSGSCSAPVGRSGGIDIVRLSSSCTTGTTIHELAHVLGLWHEHTRCDRDTYVEILWDNIKRDWLYLNQFARHCSDPTKVSPDPSPYNQTFPDGTDYSTYDFGSIMHYGPYAESRAAGLETIRVRPGYSAAGMGQRDGLSTKDVATLRHMYPIGGIQRPCCFPPAP